MKYTALSVQDIYHVYIKDYRPIHKNMKDNVM